MIKKILILGRISFLTIITNKYDIPIIPIIGLIGYNRFNNSLLQS